MIPQKIKLKNFFSHSDSVVEFVDFNSCLLIGSTEGDYDKSNGSGKSAIFESILWALFGKSRSAVANDVIKWGEIECVVEFIFLLDSKEYKVIRSRNRKSSLGDIQFYFKDGDGDWVDLSGSTNTETNKNIEKEVRLDYKTFINSVYFRQNDISEFAESEASKKKEILKNIIDLSRWDGYEKKSRLLLKESKAKLKALELNSVEYTKVLEEKEFLDNTMSDLEVESQSLSESLEAKKKYMEQVFKDYIKRKSEIDTDKYDSVVEELSKLNSESKDLNAKIVKGQTFRDNLNLKIEGVTKEKLSKEKSLSGLNFAEVDEDEFSKLREKLIALQAEGKYFKHMLGSLKSPDLSEDTCSHCGQSVNDDHRERIIESNNKKSKSYKSSMANIKTQLDTLKVSFNEMKIQKTINEDHRNLSKDLEVILFKEKSLNESMSEFEERFSSLKEKVSNINESIRINNELLESLKDKNFSSLKDQLESAKKDVSSTEQLIKGCDEKKIKTKISLSVTLEKIAMYKKNLSDIKETKNDLQRYERLSKYFGKAGIQTILLNNLIEELENKANEILETICNEPIQINLETQRLGADGTTVVETLDLKIRKDGNYHDFKSLSGGEKFRISLALRLAMSELSSIFGGTKMGFLLLDEVNSPLDRYGVETLFVSVIKSLEERYKIMVITHDESLKERFENVIEVSKVNGESTTKFYTI
jgi:DNA repair exonuclease SbcCD ATPase subunit